MAQRARRGREVSSKPAQGMFKRALLGIVAIVVVGLVLLAVLVMGGEGEGVAPDEQQGDPLPVEAEDGGGGR